MKLLRKFYRLPAKDMLLFAEAVCFLFLAKGMLLVLPFKVCIRTIHAPKSPGTSELIRLKRIKTAIRRANRLARWKNVCLVQSFAAGWMLQRRGIKPALFIGVNHNSQKNLIAHAWLKVEDFEVVPRGGEYITLTQY